MNGPLPLDDADDRCHVCRHSWDEHDGMGDCHHSDRRTKNALCNCTEKERRDG